MSKHTPGPWRSWNHVVNKRTNRIEWVISTDGRHVATLPTRTADSWDAALISAAPDLLEAAIAALIELEASHEIMKLNPIMRGIKEAAIIPKLRAAIAKAEGRS